MIGVWRRAARLAEATPTARNRAVDLLRALSILVVIVGHWLMYAPYVDADGPHYGHMLSLAPWARWMTWGLQVMPVFFFVGGYSNGVSWAAAQRRGDGYREWLAARLRRLLLPVMPLLIVWAVAVRFADAAGVPQELVRIGSQVALVPTWFLSVYLVVVLLTPLGVAAWRRHGMRTFWLPALAAVLVDAAFFGAGWTALGWVNYVLVWTAVHQLGFAWREGVPRRAGWGWLLGGLGTLIVATQFGPWPISLVGVPGEGVSNTTPPHLPLLAVAAMQFGGVLLLESGLTRWMSKPRAWTGTVLINGMIMTIFLWHSTAILVLSGIAALLGGIGLSTRPDGFEWWLLRMPWLAAAALALVPLVIVFARFERTPSSAAPAAWRMVIGSVVAGAGIGRLAYVGLSGRGIEEVLVVAAVLAGLALAVSRGRRRTEPEAQTATVTADPESATSLRG